MKRFLKYCILFSFPFVFMFVLYFIVDPFKVIKHYDNYYVKGDIVAVNRNYVSTMTYINQRGKYHYDSFIFGNSRSLFYYEKDWKKHIPASSVVYHFSESGGSINGIYNKVKFIDDCGEKINNALFVIDYGLLSSMEQDGILYAMPPQINNNRNFIDFHLTYLKGWFNVKFLRACLDYKLFGKWKPYMRNLITLGINYKYYNPINNEEQRYIQDSLISIGKYYDDEHLKPFENARGVEESPPVLNDERIAKLIEMSAILKKHHTNYSIIISPLYNQTKLNSKDVKTLNEIFGEKSVFDFSGVNDWTNDYHNYYENSHYLPSVASQIMDSIYSSTLPDIPAWPDKTK